MGPYLRRDDSEQCSTIASLLALSLGKATHLVYSSQSFGRVGRCWELLTEWVSGARDIRGTSIVRTLLVLCFSAFALLLSLTSLSLGQAISARINEVIRSSSGEKMSLPLCIAYFCNMEHYELGKIWSYSWHWLKHK